MKRVLFVVVGGFCVILIAFACITGYFTNRLNEKHKLLLTLDGVSAKLQSHKDDFQSFTSYNAKFDSIQGNFEYLAMQSARFFELVDRKITSVRLVTGDLSETELFTQQLINREHDILFDAAKIGFKENGFMGEMRKAIHDVEENYPQFRDRILSLRRHEKDFIIRLDAHYADLLHEELTTWKNKGNYPEELMKYETNFDSLFKRILQLKEHALSEASSSWITNFELLQTTLRLYRRDMLIETYSISNTAEKVQLILATLSILASLFVGLFFIRNITSQVRSLQKSMSKFVLSNYDIKHATTNGLPKNEIGQIGAHFVKMARKIKHEVNLLEERVQSRTQSLAQKNELLELQHKELYQSLQYAQNLQQSMLVSKDKLSISFQEVDVHYAPKSMVGGDFFWMKSWKTETEDKVLFCLADCTGHGVPGALLSVLGMNTLDELYSLGFKEPGVLLTQLRSTIIKRLNGQSNLRLDGMDIASFCFDRKTNELSFSGAIIPLWILRNEQIIELKSERFSIGFSYSDYSQYTTQKIQLQLDDRILLFTDGFVDQFGEVTEKKFGKKRLREMIHAAMKHGHAHLFEFLTHAFESWKGKSEQTDDMTVVLITPEFNREKVIVEAEVSELEMV